MTLHIQELKLYYKYMHNNLSAYLQQLPLQTNNDIHQHATRGSNNIHINRTTEFAKKCIRHQIPLLINNTPNIITNKIHTHTVYKDSPITQSTTTYGTAKNIALY